MRKFLGAFFTSVGVLVVGGCMMSCVGMFAMVDKGEVTFNKKDSLLVLDLEGVIEDGEKFLEKLRKYRKDDKVKGVLVRINSPGGSVGPSQEIFAELKRTREEFKKPVVVAGLGLVASGAYYAAAAADKIVVNPGAMVGSIGVIMQFANLERLLDWAKVNRYVIKTGKFKDIGAEYRQMTNDEKVLLQELVDNVLEQFKSDIVAGRKMKRDVVDANADGRIFTGAQAVKLGFADQIGTFDDAKKIAGELSGLGSNPELFKPKNWTREEWRHMIFEEDEESHFSGILNRATASLRLQGQPLLIWPGALGI